MRNFKDITYDTVMNIELTVSDMLAIQSALFDAANLNESRGWVQLAESNRLLRKRWEALTEDYINEADAWTRAWLEAADDRTRQKAAEDAAERAEMADDEHFMEVGND